MMKHGEKKTFKNGSHERFGRRAEVDQQRREALQEASPHPPQFQSNRQVLDGDDEARLHRRIRMRRRPPSGQDRRQLDGKIEQMRRHLAPIRHRHQPGRKVDVQSPSLKTVRLYRDDDFGGYHGSRGSEAETRRRQNPRLLLLITGFALVRPGFGLASKDLASTDKFPNATTIIMRR